MFICELPNEKEFSANFKLAEKRGAPRAIHIFKNLDSSSPITYINIFAQNNIKFDVCKVLQVQIRKEADIPDLTFDYLNRFSKINRLGSRNGMHEVREGHKLIGSTFQIVQPLHSDNQIFFDLILFAELFDTFDSNFIGFLERLLNVKKPESVYLPLPSIAAVNEKPAHSLIESPSSLECSSSSSSDVVITPFSKHTFYSSSVASSRQSIDKIINHLYSYIDSFIEKKETFTQAFDRLEIKPSIKISCPISLAVCDKPVRVCGDLFDYDSLINAAKKLPGGKYEHPLNKIAFSLNQIQPARDIAQKIEAIIAKTEAQKNEVPCL